VVGFFLGGGRGEGRRGTLERKGHRRQRHITHTELKLEEIEASHRLGGAGQGGVEGRGKGVRRPDEHPGLSEIGLS